MSWASSDSPDERARTGAEKQRKSRWPSGVTNERVTEEIKAGVWGGGTIVPEDLDG